MYLQHLSLANFRSYEHVELEFGPGFTAFVGHNGQGKTNVVEAIDYLASLGSHRVTSSAPLVRFGAEYSIVRGKLDRGERSTLLEVQINPGKANRARINRSEVPRARDIIGYLRTVLFSPEDLALVKGDPDVRRRFLDDLMALRTPRLTGLRSDYDRVVRQRNALLKSAGAMRGRGKGADLPTLDVWDDHLSRAGAQLLHARMELVRDLQSLVAEAYDEVSAGQSVAHIAYQATVAEYGPDLQPQLDAGEIPAIDVLTELLRSALLSVRGRELERGVSLVGPHRDDVLLTLGPMPAKGYASHGESWSFALALRLASFRLLSFDGPEGEPVLILDDVFAELDVKRRDRLAQLVSPARQVFVTAAVPDDVPELLAGARFDVELGRVKRVE